MSKLSSEKIELILANTRATLEMEGLTASKESEEISRKYLEEEITEEEALAAIHKLIKKSNQLERK